MKSRLQMLYDEYMHEKNNPENKTCQHQEYMKNLAMEMFAIESLMESNISEHIVMDSKMMTHGDKWKSALRNKNWKWIVYMRFADEVKDAKMDIEAMSLAEKHGEDTVAESMKLLAAQRIKNSEALAKLYMSIPFSHGTPAERERWVKEFNATLKQHEKNEHNLA